MSTLNVTILRLIFCNILPRIFREGSLTSFDRRHVSGEIVDAYVSKHSLSIEVLKVLLKVFKVKLLRALLAKTFFQFRKIPFLRSLQHRIFVLFFASLFSYSICLIMRHFNYDT